VYVRITLNEALNHRAIVRPPNENRSISRLGKSTCEDQIPTAAGFPSECEMRLPERGAPSYVVVNQCVLQQVVTHAESVIRAARKCEHATVSLCRSRRRFSRITTPSSVGETSSRCQPSPVQLLKAVDASQYDVAIRTARQVGNRVPRLDAPQQQATSNLGLIMRPLLTGPNAGAALAEIEPQTNALRAGPAGYGGG
jgi:hypothetical protein